MIYDFSFKTGSSLASLLSPSQQENIETIFGNNLYLNSEYISGAHSSNLSLNGQTLAEQSAVLIASGFDPVYQTSGDFYSRSDNPKKLYFGQNLYPKGITNKDFFYHIKDNSGEIPVGHGITPSGMEYEFNQRLSVLFPERTGTLTGMSSFDYFLNGQKIYSGISGSYRISGVNSVFYYDEQITGKIFAIPKNSGILNIFHQNADVYGQNFVEDTVFSYINGLSLNREKWVELFTGVTLIATGVQSEIFDEPVSGESISL